ncbi:MAG: VWA domain-containing protein [Deltaproteobacteria bacterium]|nr:VWA domain-containing protein [Deltaproteobacteria bacterium]
MPRADRISVLVTSLIGCAPEVTAPPPDECAAELQLRESISLLQLDAERNVDILFVIDDSASMAEAQARLARATAELIAALEQDRANYRIGITTTNSGNPWCPIDVTTPEAGQLVASSCKARLGDFVSEGGDDAQIDAQELACNEVCSLAADALVIQATRTDVDPTPNPRPWLERIEGISNLPADIAPADALACMLPQGVAGCGFEAPLESMYLALQRALTSTEASYGFLRAGTAPVIVMLTDEVDCSYADEWSDIFSASGSKVFWSDPDAAAPSSALCWNAGVQCIGDPSGYDSCDPVDKDITGDPTRKPADAVLYPLARYTDLLVGLEEQARAFAPKREAIVLTLAGVAEDGSLRYADDPDLAAQDEYGIGPGCVAPGTSALPPVRLRDFTDAITPGNLHSICSPDYGPAMTALIEHIRAQWGHGCFWQCAADTDPTTDVLDPECAVEQKYPGEPATFVRECARNGDGSYAIDPSTSYYAMPADDVDVCFAYLRDPAGTRTADPMDDMSSECTDYHLNLQFAIARRRGVPAPAGASISVDCTLADCPQYDCPNIGEL